MNTIYDGTFILGNTNELTFSAGPGIKIDSPSEGVVRIGNDETVLYETTGGIITAFNLNEAASSFNSIKFYWKWNNSVEQASLVSEILPDSQIFTLSNMSNTNGTNKYCTIGKFEFNSNYTNVTYVSGWQSSNAFPNASTSNEKFISIRKVLGCNRKENA